MTSKRCGAGALLVFVLLVPAACSRTSTGAATPVGPTSTQGIDSGVTPHGAPVVHSGLDVSRYAADPCSALTPRQLARLGVNGSGKRDDIPGGAGPNCSWSNPSTYLLISVGFDINNKNGLDDIYRGHATGQLAAYWQVTEVQEFPAAFADGGTDARASGDCQLFVGISDQLTYRVHVQASPGEDACGQAKGVAGDVLDTIRGGS